MKKKFDAKSFRWHGVSPTTYASEHSDHAGRSWRDTTRHIIKGNEDGGGFDVRYFEMAPGGFTSLECHEHVHSVICVRGSGYAVVGDAAHDMSAFDHVLVPANTAHQFVNAGEEPFGFLCIVDSVRDRPRALTADELAALQNNKNVAAKIRT
ncbi:MAG: cupin domain-containing protein [Candidatus Eremiobacteraeota bacterium]|nr:cupin domain-containing protein [Candidatus Eremiobacteraeota bacterium]